jgi:hypothetical protein
LGFIFSIEDKGILKVLTEQDKEKVSQRNIMKSKRRKERKRLLKEAKKAENV